MMYFRHLTIVALNLNSRDLLRAPISLHPSVDRWIDASMVFVKRCGLSLNTVQLRVWVWLWIWGLWAGCGQWVWWSRLASHLEILRLITRRMAWRQMAPAVSGCRGGKRALCH